MADETEKRIFIIAGPNGAGKTTFATEFLPNEADCPLFINADVIAAGLNPSDPHLVGFQAGRRMLQQIREHVQQGESFAFETTLSGRVYARRIPLWRERGLPGQAVLLAAADGRNGDRARRAARSGRRTRRARGGDSQEVRRRVAQLRASLPGLGRWVDFVR